MKRQSLAQEIDHYIERGRASTQRDFAVRSGIGHTILCRWLAGTSWQSAETVASSESALELSLGRTRSHESLTCDPRAVTKTQGSAFYAPNATVEVSYERSSVPPRRPYSLDVMVHKQAATQARSINLRRERNRYPSVEGVAENRARPRLSPTSSMETLGHRWRQWPNLKLTSSLVCGRR